MSRKNKVGPEYFRMRDDECLMRTHGAMVDFITNRPPRPSILDALSLGYGFVPQIDHFASQFVPYEPSSDDDDYDDDQYVIPGNNSYCGFSRNFLERHLPEPSKRITPEQAAKTAKELVDEEEKLKKKAEKKKQKKMRQRERRRLEKLEKENEDKGKNKPVQVDPGLEKTKLTDKDKNKIQNNNCSSIPPDPRHTTALVQSSGDEQDDDDDDDDDEEESTFEPEELDISSCFVSNAAAIAKRKLEQKPKSDRKGSNKHHGSEQKTKSVTKSQNQTDNKKVASGDTEDANDFITKSVEFAVIGNQYAASGNLQMAVKYFTDAIKHNPKEYKLFGNRSFCYEKLLQFEKALTDAEIALSMNPKWVKGLYRKGKALVGLKRYYDARLTYSEILKLDHSCKDAAEELMGVQIMQLMEMGFTKEQSSNALIINGTVEKAIASLSGLSGVAGFPLHRGNEFMSVQRNSRAQAKVPLRPLPQNQPRLNTPTPAAPNHPPELFPVWVGDLVPSVTGEKLYELFRSAGPVHSVRVLPDRRCAFVNYIRKEDCEKAIQNLHGYPIDGRVLVVRYPDRIHTRLGVSRDASTESAGKNGKQPDECYFWRTIGCVKNDRCTYRHIPENRGIDQHKGRSHQ